MGEDEYDPPIILGRPFLITTKAIIYITTGEVHFQFPSEKVCRHFNNQGHHLYYNRRSAFPISLREGMPPFQ
jgi:hypothetical protein